MKKRRGIINVPNSSKQISHAYLIFIKCVWAAIEPCIVYDFTHKIQCLWNWGSVCDLLWWSQMSYNGSTHDGNLNKWQVCVGFSHRLSERRSIKSRRVNSKYTHNIIICIDCRLWVWMIWYVRLNSARLGTLMCTDSESVATTVHILG